MYQRCSIICAEWEHDDVIGNMLPSPLALLCYKAAVPGVLFGAHLI